MLARRDIAHPYTVRNGQYVDVATDNVYVGGPDQGAYSSGPELVAFAQALANGKLLPPAFAELALSGKYPVAQATGEPAAQSISIGYGVENLIVNNQRVFGHPGGGPGASTDHNIYPGPGWTAAVLGNYKFDIAHSHRKGRDHGPRRPRTGWVRRYPDHVTDPEGSKFCIEPGPVSGR